MIFITRYQQSCILLLQPLPLFFFQPWHNPSRWSSHSIPGSAPERVWTICWLVWHLYHYPPQYPPPSGMWPSPLWHILHYFECSKKATRTSNLCQTRTTTDLFNDLKGYFKHSGPCVFFKILSTHFFLGGVVPSTWTKIARDTGCIWTSKPSQASFKGTFFFFQHRKKKKVNW